MEIDWNRLQETAERLAKPMLGAGRAYHDDLEAVDQALDLLLSTKDFVGIVRLQGLFTTIVARDSIGIHQSMNRLSKEAIHAAEQLGDIKQQAHLLGANGHNLHRQGLHQQALEHFHNSYRLYEQAGESFEALKSYYMMALCHRALGNVTAAKEVLNTTIDRINPDDPWLGNPLVVWGWFERDEGHLSAAEATFRRALFLNGRALDSDMLVAGTLADLGEVLGLQGRYDEARICFEESLRLIRNQQGQFDRQESRTEMKFAELLIQERNYVGALQLLDHADDLIAYGTYKDQLWKIELLRAMIKLRQGNIRGALRRIRSSQTIYQELGLPPREFIRHTLNRLRLGAGRVLRKPK